MEPAFRFVDSHVHFWDHSVDGLRWAILEPDWEHPRLGALPTLDAPRYAAAEFRAEVEGQGVEKIVHVQAVAASCDATLETAWLQEMGDESGWPDAIVAASALALDMGAGLEAHAAHDRFRGVRDLTAEAHLGSTAFDNGCRALSALAGSCELMVSWPVFDAVGAVARRHPDLVIVLGSAGLPVERDDAYFAEWLAAMRQLAACPNVVCKISAVASGADPHWTVESIRRWVFGCLDSFGIDRCMLASNWPVDKLFGTYGRLLSAYKEVTAQLSPSERTALFATNAERVYRI